MNEPYFRLDRPPGVPQDAEIQWLKYLLDTTPAPTFDNLRAKQSARRAFFHAYQAGKRAQEREQ